jgi:hypothetical protein
MKVIPNKLQLNVRFSAGTYCVNRMGKTASSTMSESEAVNRLAVKLWGPGDHQANRLPSGIWEIERSQDAPNT